MFCNHLYFNNKKNMSKTLAKPSEALKKATDSNLIIPNKRLDEMARTSIRPQDRHSDEVVKAHRKFFPNSKLGK